MRKLLSILLIGCIFIYESGYMLLYIFQRIEVKEQMRTSIKAHPGEYDEAFSFELRKGKVADADFEWEEEGFEFRYHGQIYDVAGSEEVNGKLILHVFNDKQEARLLKAIAGHRHQRQSPALLDLAAMVFTLEETGISFFNVTASRPVFFDVSHPHEKAMAPDIQSPPPESV